MVILRYGVPLLIEYVTLVHGYRAEIRKQLYWSGMLFMGKFEYKAKVVRVVDGDTMVVVVDLGFSISYNTHIRLLDLDTPEIFHPSCAAEKAHGEQAKLQAQLFLANKDVVIRTKKTGKYGRYLADILFDGMDYATEMKILGYEKRINYVKE